MPSAILIQINVPGSRYSRLMTRAVSLGGIYVSSSADYFGHYAERDTRATYRAAHKLENPLLSLLRRTAMSTYMLLCNYTDQGVRTIKDVPKRRAAAQELGKNFGVDIKAGYLAIGTYDLIIHAESASDDAMAKFVLSLASKGNVRTTTVKVFSQDESDKIIAAVV